MKINGFRRAAAVGLAALMVPVSSVVYAEEAAPAAVKFTINDSGNTVASLSIEGARNNTLDVGKEYYVVVTGRSGKYLSKRSINVLGIGSSTFSSNDGGHTYKAKFTLPAGSADPIEFVLSNAEEKRVSAEVGATNAASASMTITAGSDKDIHSLKIGDQITFTVTPTESNTKIAPSTVRVKQGDKTLNLTFYSTSAKDGSCYARYRIDAADDIDNYDDICVYSLDAADTQLTTAFKARAEVEDDEDNKKILRRVSIRGGGRIKQGDRVYIRPSVASGLYPENYDYYVRYNGSYLSTEFDDGYITFDAPTIANGKNADPQKDEYIFEVSAYPKQAVSVNIEVDSSAKDIVNYIDYTPTVGLKGDTVTVTAELNATPDYDYELIVEEEGLFSDILGTFTRRASSSSNSYLYRCTFKLPEADDNDDYNLVVSYGYRYDYDYDFDNSDIPTVDGLITEWSDFVSTIKNSSKDKVELDLGTSDVVPASAVKAITDIITVGKSGRSVEIKISDNVKLIIDKECVKGIDNTRSISLSEQSVTVKPAVEDKIRGDAIMSFRASNLNGVKAEISLKNSQNGNFANLYRVNSTSNKTEFVCTAPIDGGKVTEKLAGDGQYIVMSCEYSDLKGDANNDGARNAKDATEILKQTAKLSTAANGAAGIPDVNNDGQVNAKDAVWILREAAGLKN